VLPLVHEDLVITFRRASFTISPDDGCEEPSTSNPRFVRRLHDPSWKRLLLIRDAERRNGTGLDDGSARAAPATDGDATENARLKTR
jgi:hypothetical protein